MNRDALSTHIHFEPNACTGMAPKTPPYQWHPNLRPAAAGKPVLPGMDVSRIIWYRTCISPN